MNTYTKWLAINALQSQLSEFLAQLKRATESADRSMVEEANQIIEDYKKAIADLKSVEVGA